MKRNIKIGILGGVGPEATAEFYRRIILKIQETGLIKENTDFPQIIINSIPGPFFYDPYVDLTIHLEGLKELEILNVDFIVIACNTAHHFFDDFQKKTSIPILDLRKEVKNYLNINGINSVTIFGSSLTMNSNLFGLDITQNKLDPEEVDYIDKLITNFLVLGKKDIGLFQEIVQKYSNHSDALLSACTELSLLFKMLKGVSFIDTMDILVESTIQKWKELESN